MSRKLPIILIAILILFGLIVYAAYDIYTAVSPDSLCVDECNKQGCDNHTFFNCTKDINNCYYKIYQELEIGLCDTECLTNDNC